ncbi:ParB/RepB/Spo0J family partition protein [Streptomyces anthocyanicus]|uniref:ParB/RepB/Spo0J family partition protein n=1 Tax=Streptomyces anthocyanicus TaxID=68174 RepID=UPI002F90B4FE|nr:ParB/RepB/Spo0J family partition protein [Streptomyces anthocyanicus]
MSKADQLGAGRFGGGARPLSARRQAVAAATGVPTDGVAPPTVLSTDRISLNPDNPRSSLGDLTDLAGSLKTHGQKQAITVMNRDAYVKANPEREADLDPDATHVVIDGSSRLAAAREAGLASLKVMVSDEEGSTSEELLESALVANIHRQDLDELDEARALQRLLGIHGSQTALAKRLHRSQGWVSQRLALLNLTPELQARMNHEPIDLLRAVGNKPAAEQEAALRALKDERARKETDRKQRRNRKSAECEGEAETPEATKAEAHYDVIGAVAPEIAAPSRADQDRPVAQAVPEPRTDQNSSGAHPSVSRDDGPVRKIPYDEPGTLAMLLDKKIENDETFFLLLRYLNMKAASRDSKRLTDLAQSVIENLTAQAE